MNVHADPVRCVVQPAELADDGQEELGASNCVVALGGRLQVRQRPGHKKACMHADVCPMVHRSMISSFASSGCAQCVDGNK